MKTTTRTIMFKRKREGKTNYKKRLELLKGRQDRLIIRKTNTQIIFQLIKYKPEGDQVLLTVNSSALKKHGWKHSNKSIPAAYLAGLLTAKKALDLKIKNAILDLGLQTPKKGSRIYAALKGIIDAGLPIPANPEIFPGEDRINGTHIQNKEVSKDFQKIKEQLTK